MRIHFHPQTKGVALLALCSLVLQNYSPRLLCRSNANICLETMCPLDSQRPAAITAARSSSPQPHRDGEEMSDCLVRVPSNDMQE